MSTQAMLPWFLRLRLPWALHRVWVVLALVGCQLVVFLHFSLRWHASLDFCRAAAWQESLVFVLVSSAVVSVIGAFSPARPWLIAVALSLVGVVSMGAAAAPPEGWVLFNWKDAPFFRGISMSGGPYEGDWLGLMLHGGWFTTLLLVAGSALLLTLYRGVGRTRAANAQDSLLLGTAGCFFALMPLSVQGPLLLQSLAAPPALSATGLGVRLWWIVLAIGALSLLAAVLSFGLRWWWLRRVAQGRVAGFVLAQRRDQPADCGIFFDVPGFPLSLVLMRQDLDASVPLGRVVSIVSGPPSKTLADAGLE